MNSHFLLVVVYDEEWLFFCGVENIQHFKD